MRYSTIRRVGAPALAVMVSLAFALPAVGATRPDDRAGLRGVGAASEPGPVRPDDRPGLRGVGATDSASVRPDDRAGPRGIGGTAPSAVRPDDRAVRGIHPPTVAASGQPSVFGTSNSFDWAAAGAGAASAAGLMLLLGAAALTLRRSSRRAGTAA
jgi:hypothetical protein